jgi:hypothetical protein
VGQRLLEDVFNDCGDAMDEKTSDDLEEIKEDNVEAAKKNIQNDRSLGNMLW